MKSTEYAINNGNGFIKTVMEGGARGEIPGRQYDLLNQSICATFDEKVEHTTGGR